MESDPAVNNSRLGRAIVAALPQLPDRPGLEVTGKTCQMDLRGPTLIIFGMSLVLSPIAIKMIETGSTSPGSVLTQGEQAAACDANALETVGRRLGCQNDLDGMTTRRQTAGGALFVSAGG
jgi:hypothetical protein